MALATATRLNQAHRLDEQLKLFARKELRLAIAKGNRSPLGFTSEF